MPRDRFVSVPQSMARHQQGWAFVAHHMGAEVEIRSHPKGLCFSMKLGEWEPEISLDGSNSASSEKFVLSGIIRQVGSLGRNGCWRNPVDLGPPGPGQGLVREWNPGFGNPVRLGGRGHGRVSD